MGERSRLATIFSTRFPAGKALVAGAALVIAAQPASAERIETYWRLERVGTGQPSVAAYGTDFFEQRLLPVRLARLTEPAVIGNRTLAAGTFLYLVFNSDQRVGYCTLKDRSAGNQARTLFIPILDQRPCLVDSDGDHRFDRRFSVYDKWGGPPSVRGSINDAEPLGATARFEDVEVHEFPADMRMSLSFQGSRTNPARARIRVTFNGAIAGEWQEVRGVVGPGGTQFDLGNVRILLRSLTDGEAAFDLQWAPDTYISSDNRNTLYWNPLPGFLAAN